MRYHLNFRDLKEENRNASRFQHEACKLRKHLTDYDPATVDLRGSIAVLPQKGGFEARLRLHLPSGILTATGRGLTRASAWGATVDDMEARIERHRARLVGSRDRMRRQRDEERWRVPDADPSDNGREIRGKLQVAYDDLLAFIRSEIGMHRRKGNLPRGAVDPVDLADAVVVEVLQHPERQPPDLSYEHWFYKVAYEQLLEAIDFARQARERPESGPELDSLIPEAVGPEGIVDEDGLVDAWIRPGPRPRLADQIPDPRSLPER